MCIQIRQTTCWLSLLIIRKMAEGLSASAIYSAKLFCKAKWF